LAERAAELYADQGWSAAAAHLDGGKDLAAEAWARFAVEVYNEDHLDDAERAVRRALTLEPGRGDALMFFAELLEETGRPDDAIESYRRLLAAHPGAAEQALALARLLAERGEIAEAAAVLAPFADHELLTLRLELADLRDRLGEHEAVLAIVDPIIARMKLELGNVLTGPLRQELAADYLHARRLHDEAFAALHGREKVIEASVKRGDLDAHAGVNYRLLGQARLARPPRWAIDTRLRSVEEGLAFGESLIAASERSRGLCHIATSKLRVGLFREARALFDEARALDDDNFAAYLGLGAAMELDGSSIFDLIERLPERGPSGDLERVVSDWPVLTRDERRVVTALSVPFARVLPAVAAAGGVARILPVDARLTDLAGMQTAEGVRMDDHRCLEAITGAANAQLAASKIENLLLLTGSTFAHELAHLVHHHAPEPVQRRIDALYERAMAEDHVITAYQTKNVAEFFAVAYTDFLAELCGLPAVREPDDVGILEDTYALIEELGGE
jgi:tetratricopeptide (TPR) repeat protein